MAELTQEQQAEVDRFGIFDGLGQVEAVQMEAARIGYPIERVRLRLAPMPEQGLHKTPEQMVDDLEWAKHAAGLVALSLKESSELVRDARRRWARAHALALRASTGKSSEQREADALLATEDEQLALDIAEVALEYAKGLARAVEQTGTMTQTQASMVREQMRLAGTGRES